MRVLGRFFFSKSRLSALSFSSAILVLSLPLIASPLPSDLDHAPPSFAWNGSKAVPVDFETVDLSLRFDVQTQKVFGSARIEFFQRETGFPFFDMVPSVNAIALNGQSLAASSLQLADVPGNATKMRVLNKEIAGETANVLEIEYVLSNGVTFASGSVRAGFFMNDLAAGGRGFFEQYAPANLEFDKYQQEIQVQVIGSAKSHVLMVNGDAVELGSNSWRVTYPDWYNTSAFYFHLFEEGRFAIRRADYQGVAKTIRLITYAASSSNADAGMTKTKQVMAENEAAYGPYTHDQFIAYVTPDGGGMEHCGATMTSLRALGHELTHSWFARGVMPVDGNAGWIDEAVASWRDNGYPRYGAPNRPAVNLGGFSVYKRETTQAAYTDGMRLIGEFDGLFVGAGGMKRILKDLFSERQRSRISVGYFKTFLTAQTGSNLDALFNRYVFGRASRQDTFSQPIAPSFHTPGPIQNFSANPKIWHPRPYTQEELEMYR